MRLSYEDSFKLLNEKVDLLGEPKPLVSRLPHFDDENPGPSIFRTLVEDTSFSKITLPGLLIGRSELRDVSFSEADLHLSVMNWNNFKNCDFTDCDLTQCDLRAAEFENCNFNRAKFTDADLRGASFTDCRFDQAVFANTKLYKSEKRRGIFKSGPDQESLPLSKDQRAQATWLNDIPEPGGG